MVPIVGSWIGGSTSQLVLKEVVDCSEELFVAILVIPMLFNFLYRSNTKALPAKSVNIAWYGNFLSKVLDQRGFVILLAAILLVVMLVVVEALLWIAVLFILPGLY